MKSTKMIAATLAIVLSLSLVSGCGTPKDGEPQTPATDNTQGDADKKIRTDLVIGQSADVVNPDPHKQNDTASGRVIRMMYDTLVYTDNEGKQQPSLAESWEFISDTEIRFIIRKGVTFHDGSPLTAKDVKFSIDRQRELPTAKAFVSAVSDVKIEDDFSVVMTTAGPYAPMLYNLSMAGSSILSKDYVEATEAAGKDISGAPMGTGPMKYKSWTPNDKYVVERNDAYWGEKAVATTVEMRVIPESSSRTIALETGEIHMIDSVPAVDISRVLESQELTTIKQPSPGITYISYNMLKAPYDDVRVRQALSYATNKENMVDVICEGYASEINTILAPTMPSNDQSFNLYPYDPVKAKELMTEAGYPDGLTLKMATSGDERSRISQLLQSDYSKINVTLEIDLLEWGAYIDVISGKDHDMFVIGWTSGSEPDTAIAPVFHSENGGPTGNRSWYKNTEVDALIEKGRTTLVWEEREAIYKELQQKIMADAVWIPLFAKETVIAMNKNLKGVRIAPTDNHIYVYAYLEAE